MWDTILVGYFNAENVMFLLTGGGGESWLRRGIGDPGDRVMNPINAITFSCAAIHFPTVYSIINGQFNVENVMFSLSDGGEIAQLVTLGAGL